MNVFYTHETAWATFACMLQYACPVLFLLSIFTSSSSCAQDIGLGVESEMFILNCSKDSLSVCSTDLVNSKYFSCQMQECWSHDCSVADTLIHQYSVFMRCLSSLQNFSLILISTAQFCNGILHLPNYTGKLMWPYLRQSFRAHFAIMIHRDTQGENNNSWLLQHYPKPECICNNSHSKSWQASDRTGAKLSHDSDREAVEKVEDIKPPWYFYSLSTLEIYI